MKRPRPCIRPATLADLPAILGLIRVYAKRELMLPLSYGDAIDRLRDFLLLSEGRRGPVAGTVAVHPVWEGMAELRSLAVAEAFQGRGHGRALVQAAVQEARRLGAVRLFTLSYVPDFFRRLGFKDVDRQTLPHKVWQDCVKCPKFPDCGETALALRVGRARGGSGTAVAP